MNVVLINKFGSLLVATSFIVYGFACLYDPYMKSEFKRYGVPKMRKLTGALQIIGACTLLFLIYFFDQPRVVALVHAFFCVMMLGALWIRIRIKDSIGRMFPAMIYFFLSSSMFFTYWMQIS